MDSKNAVQQKLIAYAERHCWTKFLLEFLRALTKYSWLFPTIVAFFSFLLKRLYADGLNGYFSYYKLVIPKLETSFDQIVAIVFSAMLIFFLLAAAGFGFFYVAKRKTSLLLKLFDLVLLCISYSFFSVTALFLSLSPNYSGQIFFLILLSHAIFFLTLTTGISGIRDAVGLLCCHTRHLKRMMLLFLFSIILLLLWMFFGAEIFLIILPLYAVFFAFFFIYFGFLFFLFSIFPYFSEARFHNFFLKKSEAERQTWHRIFSVGENFFVAICLLFLFVFLKYIPFFIGNIAAASKKDYSIVEQFQNQSWAVVYETAEKFYLAPVEIDFEARHLQFLAGPSQIVGNENLPLTAQHFDTVSPPERS